MTGLWDFTKSHNVFSGLRTKQGEILAKLTTVKENSFGSYFKI